MEEGAHATKRLFFAGLCLVLIIVVCVEKILFEERTTIKRSIRAEVRSELYSYDDTVKRDLLALMMAYPGCIISFEKDVGGAVYVMMRSGKRIIYDDKKTKTYEQKLATPDLQDMLEQIYPLFDINDLSKNNVDPGRIRVYGFLEEVYGSTEAEIMENLISVDVGLRHCLFNKNNNAAASLKASFIEILSLIEREPNIYAFVYPLGGTFNYRVVLGTNRLSMHSYGIAIDLRLDNFDYWKFATKAQGQKRLEIYPKSLVWIFENHGFIWGGKWEHFDMVHYEYRPELIIKSKYLVKERNPLEPWYCGFPDTEAVRKYIRMIECALD